MKRREAVAAVIAGTAVVLAVMVVFAIQLSDNEARSTAGIKSQVHERSQARVTLQTRRAEAVTGLPSGHPDGEHAQSEDPYVAF